MDTNQLYLLKDRRFFPLFITQFCGCFNDNLIKNALVMLVTYKLSNSMSMPAAFMILIANAVFISPFILFAGLAGQIADKFERSTIVKIIKFTEIGIALFAMYAFHHEQIIFLYICIGLMGTHSTFFGPLKYSMLPDHLHKDELLGANGYIEAGTFISILIGTLLGGFYISGANFVIFTMIFFAIAGFVASFYIPKSNNASPDLVINYNLFEETVNVLKYSYAKKQIFLTTLGISWFWFIGAALLAEIPMLAREVFRADETVANLFLAIFSIGVGFGSFWCNKLFENEITTKYVFISAIGISLCGIDLFFASKLSAIKYEPETLISVWDFLASLNNWRILLDLFLLSAISGLYVVPLFAVMQYFSSPTYRSRVIAANNVLNAVFMIASTILLSVLFKLGFAVPSVILIISIMNICVAAYIYKLLPEARIIPEPIVRAIFKFIFDKMYNVEVRGLENFDKAGKRSVIIANHVSYLDPALLGVYLPERVTFAINTAVAEVGWVKPFLKVGKTYPIDPSNPMAIKSLINEVKKNKKIVIFPEGRISSTGSLMKIYEGPGMIADKADATILPIRIDGAQYTHFSKLRYFTKKKLFPKIIITILPPVKLDAPDESVSRQRRKYLAAKLYDIMCDMMFESADYQKTLFQSLIDASRVHGFGTQIVQDKDGNVTTYRQLLTKAYVLGKLIAKSTNAGEYVGLMLPNAVGSAITFFAMQAYGRVPAMINFTSGASAIISSCETAQVRTIYTSRNFIEKAELGELAKSLEKKFHIIYLEDLRKEVTIFDKLQGVMAGFAPDMYYNMICEKIDDTQAAIILFTSGTEGQPKAVVLSHRNIQANRCQVGARLDFGVHDIAFNALPMFHCFGMTGMLLMVMGGIRTFFYPSPLHYRIIPEMIYDIGATILFGTDTFLNGYAKYAHPYDFYALRYVIAGAEKLKSETRKLWFEKYGVRILEGYGATEAAPVVSANTFMHEKVGTVGRPMPKVECFVKDVDGITEGGLLCIKGPNVMLGYIKSDNPGMIVPPFEEGLGEGWYNTGDIVSIDEDCYIKILGRAKRFAKIAGEMVSLSVVEDMAMNIDKEAMHAAVHIADDRKGEQILIFTTSDKISRDSMKDMIKANSISDLYLPKYFIVLAEIPVLATGKTNYRLLLEMAEEYAEGGE